MCVWLSVLYVRHVHFFVSICTNRKQDRRIDSLEYAKYKPDLRINSWSGRVTGSFQLTFSIVNRGEDVTLLEFVCTKGYLDEQNKDLPYYHDHGKERMVYLSRDYVVFPQEFEMKMLVRDKLGRKFWIPIKTDGNKPYIYNDGIVEVETDTRKTSRKRNRKKR
jgi:hypothetical protein